ncbi:MAG: M24 family metallopeptidase, partial [Pseudomonadota bacterium]
MPIEIFSSAEIERLRRAGAVAAATLAYVGEKLRAGVSTADIDVWVREDTARRGAKPSQLGYHGFPHAVCVSRNQVVCHGMPNGRERLEDGDIVNVDVTSHIDGFHGDCSATFEIGEVSSDARRLVEVARRARDAGIAEVRAGAYLGNVGAAIVELARREG